MDLKKLRLSGALMAVAVLVLAPPMKFGYDAVRGTATNLRSVTSMASVKTFSAAATPKKAVVAHCTRATRTVTVPIQESRDFMGKKYGFAGNAKVLLCTDKRGTTVYGQTTTARAIDTQDASIQLKIGSPKTKVIKGTTIITRPTRAVITTKWKNTYVLVNNVTMKVTPKGAVKVSFSSPILTK